MTLQLTYAGFNYVADVDGSYASANSLPAMISDTDSNSVALTVDYGIDAATSTVYANYTSGGITGNTETLADLTAEIKSAEAKGLTVTVRPLIDFLPTATPAMLKSPTGTQYSNPEWRAYYNPANVATFFASYQTMIVAAATAAQAGGAQILDIGTELDQLTGPAYTSYWTSIIKAVQAVFHGQLTYSAISDDDLSPWHGSWVGTGLPAGTGNIATQVSFWNQLDYVGIDEYAAISDAHNGGANPDPTLAQLIAGWEDTPTDPTTLQMTGGLSLIQYYENVAKATGKPLLFTELGYNSAPDAASQPFYTSSDTYDPTLQANLYKAFFTAWEAQGNTSLQGVYIWNWEPDPSTVGAGSGPNWTPQGDTGSLQAVDAAYSTSIAYVVSSAQTSSGITLQGNDTETVLSGGTAIDTTVSSGGLLTVSSGGIASGTTVDSGGTEDIYGKASGTTVSSGGTVYVSSGGTASGTIVRSGGNEHVQAGGTVVSNTVSNGGKEYVYGMASGTVVNSGGTEYVSGGGTASGTTVNSGGIAYVFSGGTASGTTLSNGDEVVSSGGTAVGTTVGSGGKEFVYGTASSAMLSGGTEFVYAGGTANGTTVRGGGEEDVVSGGTASGTIVSGGGEEVVHGNAINTTLSSGGTEYVLAGGKASGAVVRSGGREYVYGKASDTHVSSGGTAYVSAGGMASATVISAGGKEIVTAGGIDRFSVVSSGGMEFISSAGTVSGGTVISGGTITVASTGHVLDGLTISGGIAVLSGSVVAGQTVRFASSNGELAIGDLSGFGGVSSGGAEPVLKGFAKGDLLLLGGFAYSGATRSFTEAASRTSGTLSVSAGSNQAHLILDGSYVTSDFTLASDGAVGTFVKFT
jgi:autotransporter passenger strand-loop-strand repeat protein